LQTVGASEAEKRADQYAVEVAAALRRLGGGDGANGDKKD